MNVFEKGNGELFKINISNDPDYLNCDFFIVLNNFEGTDIFYRIKNLHFGCNENYKFCRKIPAVKNKMPIFENDFIVCYSEIELTPIKKD